MRSSDWSSDVCSADLSDGARDVLHRHFSVDTLAGFGLVDLPVATCAAGALLRYVSRTQTQSLSHIQAIRVDHAGEYVVLDPVTRKNLELTETISGEESPTLFSTLDHCATPMGSRLLRRWLHHPLQDNPPALERQQAIAAFRSAPPDMQPQGDRKSTRRHSGQ